MLPGYDHIRRFLLPFCGLVLLFCVGTARGVQDPSLSAGVMYTGEIAAVSSGGAEEGTTYLGNLDLTASMGLDPYLGTHGSSLFLYVLANHGGEPSAYVGDIQTVSNIQAPEGISIFEAWFQTRFLDDHISALIGLYDLNSEFDVVQAASLFINSSHGIGAEFSQSGENGPSIFPVTSAGLRLRAVPTPHLYLQAAVLDGVPGDLSRGRGTYLTFGEGEGLLLAVETGITHTPGGEDPVPVGAHHQARHERVGREGGGPHQTKFAAGAWTYTEPADPIDPASITGGRRNRGFYAMAESMLGHHRDDSHRGLSAFVRAGIAEPEVNRLASYLGTGLVYSGPFTREDRDQLGVALARANDSEAWLRAQRAAGGDPSGAETTLEATYSFEVSTFLVVQGDVQYVMDPGSTTSSDHALVCLIRFRLIY